jgi:hypothetical protein
MLFLCQQLKLETVNCPIRSMQLESALQILAIEIKYVQDAFRKAE